MDFTKWFTAPLDAVLMVALTTLSIYVAVIVFTRLSGLRSFSTMLSFDFVMTVAIGSVMVTTVAAEDPPYVQGLAAIAMLFLLQWIVARLRLASDWANWIVDNRPILLIAEGEVLYDNMRKARVTEEDLFGKLRQHGVTDVSRVRALILETTADISLMEGDLGGPPLDARLFAKVRGRERLALRRGREGRA